MKGFADSLPSIKQIRFKLNQIELLLTDGRIIIAPLSRFPDIKKLTASQRKQHHIIAGIGFDFDDCDEVYHISEFLGTDNSSVIPAQKSKTYKRQSLLTAFSEKSHDYKKNKK